MYNEASSFGTVLIWCVCLRTQLDNVLLATDAEGQVCVKVCDFGYSKSQPDCNTRCGTPEYMAPEVSPTPTFAHGGSGYLCWCSS